jgi:hypothetical protein
MPKIVIDELKACCEQSAVISNAMADVVIDNSHDITCHDDELEDVDDVSTEQPVNMDHTPVAVIDHGNLKKIIDDLRTDILLKPHWDMARRIKSNMFIKDRAL